MFGSSNPYNAAMNQFSQFTNKAENAQNPFLQAGQNAIPGYQNWINSMQDPSAFINNLMGGYNESPWAQYEQQQAMRAGTNAASASGLSGSTPMAQQMQQNASNISSQDMNQWLQNVLGINTQYGSGLNNMMGYGAGAANALTGFYGNMADAMGGAAFGKQASQNNGMANIFGDLAGFLF
jgi:hypothetical protein